MMVQLGNRIGMGVIPIGNADNAKIRYVVVDPGGPIRFIQRAKCIAADAELKVARFESNRLGLTIPRAPKNRCT